MHLRPLAESDIPRLVDIVVRTNYDSPIAHYKNPTIDACPLSFRRQCSRRLKLNLTRPGMICWVAETDEHDRLQDKYFGDESHQSSNEGRSGGLVVGGAIWVRKGTGPVAKNWQRLNGDWTSSFERFLQPLQAKYYELPLFHLERSLDQGRYRQIVSRLYRPWDPAIFHESWECWGLFVDPDFQRRGVGSWLCRQATDQAQAEGVPIVLQSSIPGFSTYEKAGFKVFDELRWEAVDGVAVDIRAWSMVWEPRGMEGKWLDRAKMSVQEQSGKDEIEVELPKRAVP
jgi:GNAT superfamily N-acetyltransferase